MILSVKQGNGNKIHIYVDDEYRATVDSDYWYSEKYRNLKEINEEELTELLDAVSFRRAYNKGLDFLSRRPYGTNELIKKLCEKGHEKVSAQKACERLFTVTEQPSLRSIITVLKNGQDKLEIESKRFKQASEKRSTGITRGLSAYRNGGDAE